jgi:hypothetical protein
VSMMVSLPFRASYRAIGGAASLAAPAPGLRTHSLLAF